MARKDKAFNKNEKPGPNQCMINPPKLGPIILAILNNPELSEMADDKCSLGTISMTKACRIVASSELILPNSKVKMIMCIKEI